MPTCRMRPRPRRLRFPPFLCPRWSGPGVCLAMKPTALTIRRPALVEATRSSWTRGPATRWSSVSSSSPTAVQCKLRQWDGRSPDRDRRARPKGLGVWIWVGQKTTLDRAVHDDSWRSEKHRRRLRERRIVGLSDRRCTIPRTRVARTSRQTAAGNRHFRNTMRAVGERGPPRLRALRELNRSLVTVTIWVDSGNLACANRQSRWAVATPTFAESSLWSL
jgi:hypothetical protein